MKNNKQQQRQMKKIKIAGIGLLALSFGVSSCRSTDNTIHDNNNTNGQVSVKIDLAGETTDAEDSSPLKKASVDESVSSISAVQKHIVKIDDFYSAEVTLTPKRQTSDLSAKAAINPTAAIQKTPINRTIQYRVVVYDTQTGNYVDNKIFTSNNTNNPVFTLNGGQNYTFIAYSLNTNTTPPAINTGLTLAQAQLSAITGDFMFFKKSFTPSGNGDGKNYLGVELKHWFSQITTKLNTSNVANTGMITVIGSPVIKGGSTSADVKFNDNTNPDPTFTYNGAGNGSVPVNFPATLPAANPITRYSAPKTPPDPVYNMVNSTSPAIIIPSTNALAMNGSLVFNNLVIDGLAIPNFTVPSVKINPAKSYDLNVRLTPCVTNYNMGSNTFDTDAFSSPKFQSFPGISDLYVVDFFYLDNSFNINFNGINIAPQELQFSTGPVVGTRTVAFASDNAQWGINGIPQIWDMGDSNLSNQSMFLAPVVRVTIDRNGNVKLYGKRSQTSNVLEPLKYVGTGALRTISWQPTGNNVNITQVNEPPNRLVGLAYGKQFGTCPPQ